MSLNPVKNSAGTPDVLTLYGEPFSSRLLLGTALYPSPDVLRRSIEASGAGVLTVSLRRETVGWHRAGDSRQPTPNLRAGYRNRF